MKKQLLLLLIGMLIILFNCAGSNNSIPIFEDSPKKKLPLIPPGVDSSLALKWREKAKKLFSTFQARKQADTIFIATKDYIDVVNDLYSKIKVKKDSLTILKKRIINFRKHLKEKKSKLLKDRWKLKKMVEKARSDSTTIEIVFSLLEYFLFDARDKLEYAYSIDPFNLNILQLTGKGEHHRGRMYSNNEAFESALKYFFRYLEHDKGNYTIYHDISLTFFELKKWRKSLEYSRQALTTYVADSYFRSKEQKKVFAADTTIPFPKYIDPKEYFVLLYQKGLAEIKCHEGDSAYVTLTQALAVAQTDLQRKSVEGWLKYYVLWDGKNIANAVRYQEIGDSSKVGNYDWVYQALLDLLPKLETKRARHRVIYDLAKLDYGHFERYEEAVKRLYPVVAELDSNPKTPDFFELPADTAEQKYFIQCGEMLLNLGKKLRAMGELDLARKYLAQDTTIEWKGRAKAFLLIVPKVPDNYVGRERQLLFYKKRLKLLMRARDLWEDLSEQEINTVYKAITDIYRSLGDQANLRKYYNEWMRWKMSASR